MHCRENEEVGQTVGDLMALPRMDDSGVQKTDGQHKNNVVLLQLELIRHELWRRREKQRNFQRSFCIPCFAENGGKNSIELTKEICYRIFSAEEIKLATNNNSSRQGLRPHMTVSATF